jgi:cold shock CspA family protein
MKPRPLKELLGLRGAGQIRGEKIKCNQFSRASQRETGVIVRWFSKQEGRQGPVGGFGFLKPDGANHDLFFHGLRVIEGEPRNGAKVEFTRMENAESKRPFATEIKVFGAMALR